MKKTQAILYFILIVISEMANGDVMEKIENVREEKFSSPENFAQFLYNLTDFGSNISCDLYSKFFEGE